MRSIKALELLRQNRINELKAKLEDEVYQDSLKTRPNAKKRYTAMKKYFSYHNSGREILQKPCPIEYEGQQYTSFTNSWSLALTTEPTGEIALCDEPDRYPDVRRIISFNGEEGQIDFADVFARAKSRGYKLNRAGFSSNQYLMHYDGSYFRLALLDATYGIIDNGTIATVYHAPNSIRPLTIQTEIGICVIMPIRFDGNPDASGNVIIEVSKDEVVTVDTDEIAELITRRRRQVLVHSVIYYKMDDNLISDAQWSKWAFELAELQNKYPEIAKTCWYADEFEGFEGSSGYDLPLDDLWAEQVARRLIQIRDRRASNNT